MEKSIKIGDKVKVLESEMFPDIYGIVEGVSRTQIVIRFGDKIGHYHPGKNTFEKWKIENI